jgi:hypothetical protein
MSEDFYNRDRDSGDDGHFDGDDEFRRVRMVTHTNDLPFDTEMLEVKRDDMQRLLSALEDARDDMSAASNAIVSMLATLLPKAATSFTFNALAREMSPQLLDVLRILHPLSRKTVSEILADRMASEKISQAE